MSMEEVKTVATDFLTNFEILAPPKRTAVILGEEIDISLIPAKTSFGFIKFSQKYDVKKIEGMTEESFDPKMIEDMLDMMCQIWQESNPKITKDWLLSNLSIVDLMRFVQFVFAGMVKTRTEEEGSDGKN